MRARGTISLFNERGTCLNSRRYDSKTHRKYIIEGWRNLFHSRMSGYFIHISPEVSENIPGLTIRHRMLLKRKAS
jgi:hypothetical protein